MNKKFFIFLFFFLLNILKADVSIVEENWAVYTRQDKPDILEKHKVFKFDSGSPYKYGIKLSLYQKKDEEGIYRTYENWIGMPYPSYSNWYHTGFFNILVNGKKINDRDLEFEIVETGEKGILDFIFDHSLIKLRIRFISEEKSNYLIMEVKWITNPEIKDIKINFATYPQGFWTTGKARLDGKKTERHMVTAERDVAQVQNVKLNLPTEWWQIYQDNTLSKYKEGANFSGPCAFGVFPKDVKEVNVNVGDYTVSLRLDLNVENGRARFVLWDFADKTPDECKKIMEEKAPLIFEKMGREEIYLSEIFSTFDIKKEKEKIENLNKKLKKKNVIEELKEKLNILEANFKDKEKYLKNFIFEKEVRDTYNDYYTKLWEFEKKFKKEINILLLSGPFAYGWNIKDIIKKNWEMNSLKEGCYIWKYWQGHFISYFPGTFEELLKYDVVILGDIPLDPFNEKQIENLYKFVKIGGGLIICGGIYAYGNGKWEGKVLKELLPFSIKGVFDLRQVEGDLYILLTQKGEKITGIKRKIFEKEKISVFWYNEVILEKDSEILMTIGEKIPFAVYSERGKGRVIAFTGTCLGEKDDKIPFWESNIWEEIFKKCILFVSKKETL